jgi:hypothetical protein
VWDCRIGNTEPTRYRQLDLSLAFEYLFAINSNKRKLFARAYSEAVIFFKKHKHKKQPGKKY